MLFFLILVFEQFDFGFSRTGNVLNCFFKIVKFIFIRGLEKRRVILCEIQSQLEIFLLFILGQTKPTRSYVDYLPGLVSVGEARAVISFSACSQ
jgi:hypothetical protein